MENHPENNISSCNATLYHVTKACKIEDSQIYVTDTQLHQIFYWSTAEQVCKTRKK